MSGRSLFTHVVLFSCAALAACSPPAQTDAGDAGDASDVAVAPDVADAMRPMDAGDDVARDAVTDAPVDTPADAPADSGDGGAACPLTRVIVTTTDFMTGGYVVGDLATRALRRVDPGTDAGAAVDQDHAVRTSGCLTFDLWRTPGTIAVLDPANVARPVRTIALPRVSAGADAATQSANPHDIELVGRNRAYVTQYNTARLAIVDVGAGMVTGTVDLAPLADSDGIPEAEAIAVVGSRAFVTLQLLDRARMYAPPANSVVAVVDTATDMVVDADPMMAGVQGIRLSFGNPPGRIAVTPDGRHLLVASSGAFGRDDGGVDVIDVASLRVVRSVSAMMLRGEPGSVEAVSNTTAWVAITRTMGMASSFEIVSVDLTTGVVAPMSVATSTTVAFGNLRRAPDGTVWAIDAGFSLMGSVHAFSATGTPLGAPFATPGSNTYTLDFAP